MLVKFCPPVNLGSHMLVKSLCLGILLVYSQTLNAVVLDPVSDQALSSLFAFLFFYYFKNEPLTLLSCVS